MNFRYTIPLLLSIAILTACSENYASEEAQQRPTHNEDLVPVQFSVSDQRTADFSSFTRATTSIITFDANEIVKVFVKANGASGYTDYDYTTASSGQSVNLTVPATPPYYPPGTNTTVEAYAYYPSTAGSTFTVASDQTSDADYKASDLMYAINRTVTKGLNDGNNLLQMAHQMAQLNITANVQAASDLTISRVEVIAQKSVTFAPNSANIVTTTGSSGTIIALNSAGTGYIVIPPQSINGVIIKVITGLGTNDEIATYAFTGSGTFNSGDSYAIDLTVSPDQLGFTTAINNWNGVGSVNVIPAGTLTILSYPGLTAIPAQEFTDSAIEPAFIVKKGDETVDPSLYTTIWVNNVNSGKAYIIVTGKGTQEGTVGMTSFTITPANGKIVYDVPSVTKTYGNEPFVNPLRNYDKRTEPEYVGKLGDGPVTYVSSNPDVATVDETTGEVTMLKAGTITITATATNGANYVYSTNNPVDNTASYELTVNKAAASITFPYSGPTNPSKTWSPTEANTYMQTVTNTGDASVTYAIGSTNTCDATINPSTGEVTFTKSGSVEITATVPASTDRYEYASTTASYTLTVNKASGFVEISPTSGNVDAGSSTSFTITSSHGGTLSVANASGGGRATPVLSGTTVNISTTSGSASSATIRVTCAATDYYSEATADYTLTINASIDIMRNPLYYVAEHNVANYAGTALATSDDAGYFFTYADAVSRFAAQNSGYSDYRNAKKNIGGINYHLPIQAEWWSIIPGSDVNIFTFDSGSGTLKSAYISPKWGYNTTTKETGIIETSYWKKISSTEIRAIRFLGTEFCSAWKYVWANNALTIYATLIDQVEDSNAATWYTTNFNGVTWGNIESLGAVQRTFYACGERENNTSSSGGSGATGTSNVNKYAFYWSATDFNHPQYGIVGNSPYIWNGYANVQWAYKGYGFTIRLFRDNPQN